MPSGNWYNGLAPDNPANAVRDFLQSQSAIDSYAPKSVPWQAVRLPFVTALPTSGMNDGDEVNLYDEASQTVTRWLFVKVINDWVQVGAAPLVTSLPSSAVVEGMRIVYDTGTAGVRWDLVYDTSDGTTYPWLYVGGPPLSAAVATSQSTASATFAALATAGPVVTLPLAGDYDVSLGCKGNNDTDGDGGMMSYDIGGTGAVDADSVEFFQTGGTSITATNFRVKRKTGLTAVALTAKYRRTVGGSAFFSERYIAATPVRVG